MRKIVSAVLILLLVTAALPGARAEDYPPFQGIVTDMADGVLSEDAVKELKELAEKMEAAVDGRVYVLTRHFLGGASPQSYADQVFKAWSLKENDALILMVVGEEAYAVAMGDLAKNSMTKESVDMLMANHFRAAFLNREYSRAAVEAAQTLAQALVKAQGGTASALLGQEEMQQPQSIQDSWDTIWEKAKQSQENMYAQNDYQDESKDLNQIWEQEEHKTNWRTIIIWILVIYFLFFRKKRRGRR